jgi:hypothetical protein
MSERPPVEYADVSRRGGEAVRSLARFLGVSEARAVGCLADPAEFRAELRLRPLSVREARRQLERRYAVPL